MLVPSLERKATHTKRFPAGLAAVGMLAGWMGAVGSAAEGGTELWWILPKAGAGAPQEWKAALARGPAPTKDVFSLADTAGDHLDVLFAGRSEGGARGAFDTAPFFCLNRPKPLPPVFLEP